MKNSKIGWTHDTWNLWRGCTEVSPACDNCYAREQAKRFPNTLGRWGPGVPRVMAAKAYQMLPYQWDRAAAKAGERRRVFALSFGDVLDTEAPPGAFEQLIKTAVETPNLDWLLLTKRHNRLGMIPDAIEALTGKPSAPNIWLGVTAETQQWYDIRWDVLRRIPAPVRWVSMEPLLGPITMNRSDHKQRPDWIIVGGESATGSIAPRRPIITMQEEWATSLRDEAAGTNTAFFFKQWGGITSKAGGNKLQGQIIEEFPTPRA